MKGAFAGLFLVAATLLGVAWLDRASEAPRPNGPVDTRRESPEIDRATGSRENRRPDERTEAGAQRQLEGSGIVVKVLADDNDGSRHQRFILRRESGATVLVAHNIDVAPRIPALRQGDTVEFFGEFEPNAKGGVVHWTHRDPAGRHVDGWLRHDGVTYQ